MPTRGGSPLTDSRPAAADAPIVERLRSAGAIILGKTVTTEFACFDPPPTRNPWDSGRTPGGSSSGSAAAMALGMCPGATSFANGGVDYSPGQLLRHRWLQTDLRPRQPPRRGAGQFPPGPRGRDGPHGRRLCGAAGGHRRRRPARPGQRAAPRFRLASGSARRPRRRVWACCASSFSTRPKRRPPSSSNTRLATCVRRARSWSKCRFPPASTKVHVMHRRVMACEAALYHRQQYGAPRDGYGPNMAAFLDEGLKISLADYAEALRHQKAFGHAVARLFARHRRAGHSRHARPGPGCRNHRRPAIQLPLEPRRRADRVDPLRANRRIACRSRCNSSARPGANRGCSKRQCGVKSTWALSCRRRRHKTA